jgi:hypothetical protein
VLAVELEDDQPEASASDLLIMKWVVVEAAEVLMLK